MLSYFIQFMASILTIASVWQYGNKTIYGPYLGLSSQIFWWSMMFVDGLYGLLPLNLLMLVTHIRNLKKMKENNEIT